jgi:hypothetical protein
MNASAESASAREPHRLRFELIFGSLLLAFGLFVFPAAIYAVGTALLDAYGENRGIGAFYADFFRDLAEPAGRTWLLALGPLLTAYAVRAVFLGVPRDPRGVQKAAEPPPATRPAEQSRAPRRVEPRLGSE